jgi:hypothetical protein
LCGGCGGIRNAGPVRTGGTGGWWEALRTPRLPGDRQLADAEGERVGRPEFEFVPVDGEAQGRDAPVEGAVDDLELDAGELLAEALVDAPAEGVVVAGVAGEVELLRLGERLRVPVAGGQRYDDAVAGLDLGALELEVLGGDPALPELGDGQIAQDPRSRAAWPAARGCP